MVNLSAAQRANVDCAAVAIIGVTTQTVSIRTLRVVYSGVPQLGWYVRLCCCGVAYRSCTWVRVDLGERSGLGSNTPRR
jgi:hypothetical protein